MWSLWMDFCHGWRVFRRAPGVALWTIILLGLGTGGVTALSSPLYWLVLAPLPYPHSEELVRIGGNIPLFDTSTNAFQKRERLTPILSHVTAYAPVFFPTRARPSSGGPSEGVAVEGVSPEFFETMGVRPQMGRSLAGESVNASVVVLSDRFWRRELRGARDVIGCPILFEGHPYVVVGVMPEGFEFPARTDVWAPLGAVFYDVLNVESVGRMHPGLSLAQAAGRLKSIGYTRGDRKRGRGGPVLESLQSFLRGDRRPMMWMLWTVSVLFLLLACAGAANLLLARGVRRRPEMVMRLVLGAPRWRLIRQLLTETLVLAAAGALLGVWLSTLAGRWVETRLPELRVPRVFVPSTGPAVLGLALAVTILCGLAPALHATGRDLTSPLKLGSTGIRVSRAGRRAFTSHEFLAGTQLGLAMVLLIGTSLLLRSLSAMLSVALGFEPQNVAVLRTSLPLLPELTEAAENYVQQHHLDRSKGIPAKDAEALERALAPARKAESLRNVLFNREARQRLTALPQVVSVGVLSPAPLTLDAEKLHQMVRVCTKVSPAVDSWASGVSCLPGSASANAFDALGIRLLAGRTFSAEDAAGRLPMEVGRPDDGRAESGVAIINEALARSYWPKENAVGKQFYFGLTPRTVVGVVSNFHQGLFDSNVTPAAYFPSTDTGEENSFVVKLRPGSSLTQLDQDAYRSLLALAPDLPHPAFSSLQELKRSASANLRLGLPLLACFSLLGSTVAGLGVYAAAALMAAARTREMGIRIALGATAGQVRRLALWRSVRLALVVLPCGLLAGWGLAHTLSHLLFRVKPSDPITYVASGGLTGVIALVAGLQPALRLGATDPAKSIRYE
jgi:hypothetical protein